MPGLLTKAELDQMLARAETAQEVTLPIDKFRDLVLQASVSEIAPSTGQSERELFDAWLAATYDSDAEFDEARNCYKEFAVHMAWQAFRGARSLPSSIEADAHAELDKAEISRRHSRDSGATWIEYSLAERIHILAGGYAIAEREREEAQGAVSATRHSVQADLDVLATVVRTGFPPPSTHEWTSDIYRKTAERAVELHGGKNA